MSLTTLLQHARARVAGPAGRGQTLRKSFVLAVAARAQCAARGALPFAAVAAALAQGGGAVDAADHLQWAPIVCNRRKETEVSESQRFTPLSIRD